MKTRREICRAFVHMMPIVPAAMGQWIVFVIVILLVTLLYIKSMKLGVAIADYRERFPEGHREIDLLERHRQRWLYLTYLRSG